LRKYGDVLGIIMKWNSSVVRGFKKLAFVPTNAEYRVE